MNIKKSQYIGLLFFILVLSAVLRFHGLDRLSLWADELWVVMDSTRGTLWEMLYWVYGHDNHPPGYYLLLRYTQFIFGSSDFAIRLPSAIAGIALVGATFITGRKLFSSEAALIAAALVAGSYQGIYYSQEARPNIFMALFALMAFHYFRAVMLEGDRSPKNYALFCLFAAGSSYFHYAGLVFCICLGFVYLMIVATQRKKENIKSGLLLFIPLLFIYSPWIFGTLHHLSSTPVTGWQRAPDLETLQTTTWFLFGPDNLRMYFYLLVFIAALITSVVASVVPFAVAPVFYTLAMIVLPITVFFIKSNVSQDAYNHRHFLVDIPLMALLAGYFIHAGLRKFPEKNQGILLLVTVLLIVTYQGIANNSRALYTANHFKQEFREGAKVVADDKDFLAWPNTLIVSNIYFFDHYLDRFTQGARKSDFIYDHVQKIADLRSIITAQHITQFYYLEAPNIPGANQMITLEDLALMDYYSPQCRTKFPRVQVFRFFVVDHPEKPDLSTLPACTISPKND